MYGLMLAQRECVWRWLTSRMLLCRVIGWQMNGRTALVLAQSDWAAQVLIDEGVDVNIVTTVRCRLHARVLVMGLWVTLHAWLLALVTPTEGRRSHTGEQHRSDRVCHGQRLGPRAGHRAGWR